MEVKGGPALKKATSEVRTLVKSQLVSLTVLRLLVLQVFKVCEITRSGVQEAARGLHQLQSGPVCAQLETEEYDISTDDGPRKSFRCLAT